MVLPRAGAPALAQPRPGTTALSESYCRRRFWWPTRAHARSHGGGGAGVRVGAGPVPSTTVPGPSEGEGRYPPCVTHTDACLQIHEQLRARPLNTQRTLGGGGNWLLSDAGGAPQRRGYLARGLRAGLGCLMW